MQLSRRLGSVSLLGALLAAAACGPRQQAPPAGVPAPDPGPVAERLVRGTVPPSPQQAAFGWELDEAGARLRGRGVIRAHAPERLRLDLFGPRGETYLAAALVGESFRVPPAVAGRFALPSPALLWGALGVIRPPTGSRLVAASTEGEATTLRYQVADGETVEFRAEGARLRSVRRVGKSGARETVELTRSASGEIQRVEYRDWAAYRTLVLTPESITNVQALPESTWTPAGAAR